MKRLAFLAVTLVLVTGATSAQADEVSRERAKAAYDRGVDAHKHGEMARAAKEFAAADSYEPTPIALQAALDAAIDADDAALGSELLERAKREPAPPSLASSITAGTIKFGGRAGRVRIACPKRATCSAKIDETPVGVDHVVWTPVGQRTVTVQVDGGAPQSKVVDLGADQPIELTAAKGAPLQARPAAPEVSTAVDDSSAPSRRQSEGLSPYVFYAGIGLTVVLAGVTTYVMVNTAGKHGDFDDKGCERVMTAECSSLADSGRSSQSIANGALVLTAAAALVTAAIGVGFTNWRGSRSSTLRPFVYTF